MNELPIIRLELEGMRMTFCRALTEYHASIDASVQDAVERFCRPENISRIVNSSADKAMEEAIRASVDDFFRYGDGRKAIQDAVRARLGEQVKP